MDIYVKSNRFSPARIVLLALLFLLFLLAAAGCAYYLSSGPEQIPESEMWLASVKQGDVTLTVSGFGQLKSGNSSWVISETGGIVMSLPLKAGSKVEAGTLLAELHNQELDANLNKLNAEYNSLRSDLASLSAQLSGERVQQRLRVRRASSELALTKLELDATRELAEKGVVSQLHYKKQMLKADDMSDVLEGEKLASAELEKVHTAKLSAAQARLKAIQSEIVSAERKKASLRLHAPHTGMVQSLAAGVERGKFLQAGFPIVELANEHSLYAEIKVPAAKVAEIALGMRARLEWPAGALAAQVTRIDPVATNDQVSIDLAAIGEWPDSARAELPVSASIELRTLRNATFAARPPGVNPNSVNSIFVSTDDPERMKKSAIRFGALAGEHILIESGISSGTLIGTPIQDDRGSGDFIVIARGHHASSSSQEGSRGNHTR